MATERLEIKLPSVAVSDYVFFAGDRVQLAGQMDYPEILPLEHGYPVIFTIQHATCNSRTGYEHIARVGTEVGCAVFRWDKRGTGSSGAGGGGSVTEDTLAAYRTALVQRMIDPAKLFVIAQNEGTILFGEAYDEFAAIQKPAGVVLLGNMLDEKQILAIKAPVLSIVSKNDWNAWQIYADAAVKAHNKVHRLNSEFYVAPNTNRRLMYENGGSFHREAALTIQNWIVKLCSPAAI
jgi:pimeloyl-ACP methyl ester carboxylesterase